MGRMRKRPEIRKNEIGSCDNFNEKFGYWPPIIAITPNEAEWLGQPRSLMSPSSNGIET